MNLPARGAPRCKQAGFFLILYILYIHVSAVVHVFLHSLFRLRQVVLRNLPPLRPQIKPIVFHLKKRDAVRLFRQRPVQQQNGRLDPRIGLEHARRQRNDGHQIIFLPASCATAYRRSGSER